MTEMTPEFAHTLRQVFKQFNRGMILMWRLGLGKWINIWPDEGGQIMVIVHTGRKTGRRYRTPVNYAIVDNELFCTAGFGKTSDWYRNLRANPTVEVWLPDGRWLGEAEDVTEREDAARLLRAVLIGSGFAAGLFGLHPKTMSDDELKALLADYPVIHIRRIALVEGTGGPGDLAWAWLPPAILLLLLGGLRLRKSGKEPAKSREKAG